MTNLIRPSDLLDKAQVAFVSRALREWGGPAHSGDQLARGIGFPDEISLRRRCGELAAALRSDTPIEAPDWARLLLATELAFASDLVGSGTEWSTTTGMTDVETIRLLREVQFRLAPALRGYYGNPPAPHKGGE